MTDTNKKVKVICGRCALVRLVERFLLATVQSEGLEKREWRSGVTENKPLRHRHPRLLSGQRRHALTCEACAVLIARDELDRLEPEVDAIADEVVADHVDRKFRGY